MYLGIIVQGISISEVNVLLHLLFYKVLENILRPFTNSEVFLLLKVVLVNLTLSLFPALQVLIF